MTRVLKHSVTIRGHRTSFSLEAPFYEELAAIAVRRGVKFAVLVAEIDVSRPRETNLLPEPHVAHPHPGPHRRHAERVRVL